MANVTYKKPQASKFDEFSGKTKTKEVKTVEKETTSTSKSNTKK